MSQIDEVNQKGETFASIGRRMGGDPYTVKKYTNQDEFKKRETKAKVPCDGSLSLFWISG
ncbi:hypothetical protein KM914_06895 [Virgibacillus pantothenticus]|uniref:hypothetical protein n=1 Tax=Virgibacillus pantothenticus TaxID=1473 RepID=UPI001C24BD9D|nr:hypothetical protein [Virgibacillus pantothenticus]MBU8566163.1 hypothetical protein [Virgibacillus pantothenticus]MBU8600541.1 hypothetical protein [Virgibacillus pantothenticus]MBU8634483.1 hypothetical protein [Virgibacillus pantothenticus]MBU8642680.1 hypothetical protein [Virgibacillus pantothenticus]MBU8647094.1 hypothetical protein [Virgibacillus pantothenticus]